MKDIPRRCLVCFFRVLRRFFAIIKPSEQRSIASGIDTKGRLVNGGELRAALPVGELEI